MGDFFRDGDAIVAGTTGASVHVCFRKTSDSTERTDLTYTDVSCAYTRERSSPISAAAANLAAPYSAHIDNGFVAVGSDATGLYQFDIPDAALASGANLVTITLRALGCFVEHFTFALVADPIAAALDAGDVTGRLPANVQQIAGQTANAAAAVTFPGSIGTSTYAGADTAGTTTLLTRLTATRGGYLDNLSGGAVALASGVVLAAAQTLYAPAKPGDAMTLTVGERGAVATQVEAQVIDETDSNHVLAAITDKIASVNPSLGGLTLSAIASAVRTNLATELGRIDAAITSRADSTTVTAIKARTDNLPNAAIVHTLGKLWVLDGNGNAVAPAATALSTAQWTNPRATKLDHLDADVSSISGGGGSGLSGPSAVTLTFVDADANPVALVDFTVVGQGPGRAGTDGVASFGLADGDYTILAGPKNGTLFASSSLTVNGSTPLTIPGTARVLPVSTDPNKCTVSGDLVTGGGDPAANVEIIFTLCGGPARDGTNLVAGYQQRVTTDSAGHFEKSLERNDLLTPAGTTWRVRCVALKIIDQEITLASGSFDFATIVA